eukprot:6179002-Pleurochrysis_carterae.AAC.7
MECNGQRWHETREKQRAVSHSKAASYSLPLTDGMETGMRWEVCRSALGEVTLSPFEDAPEPCEECTIEVEALVVVNELRGGQGEAESDGRVGQLSARVAEVGPFESSVGASEGERDARLGATHVAARAPVHDPVRKDQGAARAQRAGADRLRVHTHTHARTYTHSRTYTRRQERTHIQPERSRREKEREQFWGLDRRNHDKHASEE